MPGQEEFSNLLTGVATSDELAAARRFYLVLLTDAGELELKEFQTLLGLGDYVRKLSGVYKGFMFCGERVEITQHQPWLVKCTDEVFPGLQIDADLATDGTVHLGQQSRGHLDERNAAQIRRRDKSGEVAHHAAAER